MRGGSRIFQTIKIECTMNDKVSRYNIEIEYNDCILLYNSLSNNLIPISIKDYTVVETLMDYLPEFLNKYPQLYRTFKKSGFIVSLDFDELAYIKFQNNKYVYGNSNYKITINPTLDCNLKCWYCSVEYAGAKHNCEQMDDNTVNALNNHIKRLIKSNNAKSIQLDWFGGEPMMHYEDILLKISRYAYTIALENDIAFQQHATTNATLLNKERICQLKDLNFTSFQIPIDGNEQRHNQIKYFKSKQGSYANVVNNINLLAEIIPNVRIILRINYDRQTLKNINEIIKDFPEESRSKIWIDFQRVWQVRSTEKELKLIDIAKESFRLAGFRAPNWSYRPQTFHCCYADTINHYVVNYNGKIFKCTARDYGDDSVIGHLQLSGEIKWNQTLLSKIFEKATFENDRCENCNILPMCMGPCIQKNYETRLKNKPLPCLKEYMKEDSLSSYVIDLAKQRNLIQ